MGEGGLIPQGSIQSARLATSKKVEVSNVAVQIVSASSANVGVLVRYLSANLGTPQISFGNSTLTSDGGLTPGALFMQAAGQGLTLNITGDIFAIASSSTVNLIVQPLFLRGI